MSCTSARDGIGDRGYAIQLYQYEHCKPHYRPCPEGADKDQAVSDKNFGAVSASCVSETVYDAQVVSKSKYPTMWHPNPFAPHGGAKEWCSNDLILHDVNLRRLARIRPLDCGLVDMIKLNPEPQI